MGMNRKILFFDLDGTLWDRAENIPSSTREALARARRQGHLLFVNTGRTRVFALREALRTLEVDGLVTGCGTRLEWRGMERASMGWGAGESCLLYDRMLPGREALDTVERLEKHGFRLLLEGPEYMYADMDKFRDDPYMRSVRRRSGETLRDLETWRGRWEISKMTCDMARSADREAVLEEMRKSWNVFVHHPDVCELVPPGHDKGTGIARLCALLDWDIRDTVAFGDGENDTDMLRTAGVGVAMGNGAPGALRAADYVTAPLEEDGIRRAMEHLGLLG